MCKTLIAGNAATITCDENGYWTSQGRCGEGTILDTQHSDNVKFYPYPVEMKPGYGVCVTGNMYGDVNAYYDWIVKYASGLEC